jgi:hypothetical protein
VRVNTNERGLYSVRVERSERKAEKRLRQLNGTTERGKGRLGLRKTNVVSFMINFIHSVYRQELQLKKKWISSQCNIFIYYLFTYLFGSLWLVYRRCPYLRLNGAQSFYWRGFDSKRQRFHVRYPSLCRAFRTETKQDRQCRYNVTLRCVRATTVVVEKTISITNFKCVFVALVIQHAKRMRRSILSSVVCPILTTFFHIIS